MPSKYQRREKYETDEDLAAQNDIAEFVQSRWRVTLQKNPPLHPIDFTVIRNGKVIGFAEVKRRHSSTAHYGRLMLSLSKWVEMWKLYESTGRKVWLIVRFGEVHKYMMYHPALKTNIEICYRGRTKQTRDKWDIEPVVLIPMELFRPFPEPPVKK
jgi:hypothetical protein